MNENTPVNFNAINPTSTEYHNDKILIITLTTKAAEMSIPCIVNKPASEPSVIPIPPGMKVIAPKKQETKKQPHYIS